MIAELEIAPKAEARWRLLDPTVRDYLRAFLTDPHAHAEHVVVQTLVVPTSFSDDLVVGGPGLRSAFPTLRRTLVAIRGSDPMTIQIVCEGSHDGSFFGFMLPTRRHVLFDEVHRLRLRGDGRLAEDRLAIDIRGIIRQLGSQDPTQALRDHG